MTAEKFSFCTIRYKCFFSNIQTFIFNYFIIIIQITDDGTASPRRLSIQKVHIHICIHIHASHTDIAKYNYKQFHNTVFFKY